MRQTKEIAACIVLHQFCRYQENRNNHQMDWYVAQNSYIPHDLEGMNSVTIRNYLTDEYVITNGIRRTNTVSVFIFLTPDLMVP